MNPSIFTIPRHLMYGTFWNIPLKNWPLLSDVGEYVIDAVLRIVHIVCIVSPTTPTKQDYQLTSWRPMRTGNGPGDGRGAWSKVQLLRLNALDTSHTLQWTTLHVQFIYIYIERERVAHSNSDSRSTKIGGGSLFRFTYCFGRCMLITTRASNNIQLMYINVLLMCFFH